MSIIGSILGFLIRGVFDLTLGLVRQLFRLMYYTVKGAITS
jgi:hypothetical protein